LALAVDFEAYIETLASTIRYVKALKRSDKMVKLSWDEWNVWYKARLDSDMDGSWTERPHLIEEVYNLEDALVVSQWMNVFMRKCDVLEMACMAQMVNVIAPILTKKDAMLLQSIYYAFKMHATRAKGVSLDSFVSVATTPTAKYGDVPMLDVAASWDATTNTGSCFVVNRSLDKSITVTISYADGQAPVQAVRAESIYGTDPKAHNTYENPGVVTTREIPVQTSAQGITITLPPLSSTAIDMRS
jgi:alpha-N-arabinofuranosidase